MTTIPERAKAQELGDLLINLADAYPDLPVCIIRTPGTDQLSVSVLNWFELGPDDYFVGPVSLTVDPTAEPDDTDLPVGEQPVEAAAERRR